MTIHEDFNESMITPHFDICILHVKIDLSERISDIPIIMENFDINQHHRSACWAAGFGRTTNKD